MPWYDGKNHLLYEGRRLCMLLAVDIGNSTISTGLFGLDGELRF